MEIKTWTPDMTDKETADLAYWQRNVLALWMASLFKGGWYNDDVENIEQIKTDSTGAYPCFLPRFKGERRVISIFDGKATFHIPDNFDVGNLPQIERNWDGHTTEEKWKRILKESGITC